MTPYAKARVMNWMLTVSFGFFLTIFVITNFVSANNEVSPSHEQFFLFLGSILPYLLTAFVAFRWPLCPACREPSHVPSQNDAAGWPMGLIARPRKRDRECSYCGHDLTVLPEDR